MSTIFIYPLEGHGQIINTNKQQQQQEDSSTSSNMTTLSSNGLSRILEIPLTLLDKADSNEMPIKNTANQMFWISANNTPKNLTTVNNTTSTTSISNDNNNSNTVNTNGEVTHSFANRKRSIVKRRKSVLSAVFTAEDEHETIQNDREEALAVLEGCTTNNSHQVTLSKEEEQKKKRNKKIALVSNDKEEKEEDSGHYLTPKMVNIMMNDITTTSPVSRGPSFLGDTGGVKSKSQRSLSNSPSETTTTATTTVYIQNDTVENREKEEYNTTPKDSAIDLGVVALLEQCPDANTTTANLEQDNKPDHNSDSDTLIDLTSAPITSKALSLPPPPPTPTLTPTKIETPTKTKKKTCSWSPRRIFQSNENISNSLKKKKSNLIASDTEEKSKSFNISSLFSRTSSTSTSSKKSSNKKTTSKSSVLLNTTSTNNNADTLTENDFDTPKRETQFNTYNHTRLPIHTERAIYRLSHLKLSNPRRPLCDQVTISNLMFWYLSIISQQNNNIENEFASSSSVADSISTNNNAFMDKEINAMTKKACRIKLQQQHPRRTGNKKYTSNHNNNRRIRNHQIGPATTYSNAMDVLKHQQQQQLTTKTTRGKTNNVSHRQKHLLSNNSSSEEEDDDEDDDDFSDDDLSDDATGGSRKDEDEGIMTDLFFGDKKRKKSNNKKYSLFNITKKKSSNNNSNSWLSSFASPKQHNVNIPHQDEDDIPLAMYQKGKA